jgi:thiamine biosynthesis protein ThiS
MSSIPTPAAVVTLDASGYRHDTRASASRNAMQVTVNDEARTLTLGATVADLVATLGLGPRRIAVEVNRAIVPRGAYDATVLADGDTIEIIHFVGGG